MSDDFPARLFPASFTLLYCPYAADQQCSIELPFPDPYQLIQHCQDVHQLEISHPGAVIPFLDRYLQARKQLPRKLVQLEDEELRNRLQQARLREILDQQAQDRTTYRTRGRHCLFCDDYCSTLSILFSHMFQQHNFNIGHLDNLVMVGEFLDTLQRKLDARTCIYCEGTFPNRPTLKKHLKNKNHYRIHPQNHLYDKYYVVNYMHPGKLYDATSPGDKEKDKDNGALSFPVEIPDNIEEDWEELDEPLEENAMCLICPHTTKSVNLCYEHMWKEHGFNFVNLTTNLEACECIQLINYFRNRQAELQCPWCNTLETVYYEQAELSQHVQERHPLPLSLPKEFRRPEYLFPVLEEDVLIWSLPQKLIDDEEREKEVWYENKLK